MSDEEAIKVVAAATNADGVCAHCFSEVVRALIKLLPNTDWIEACGHIEEWDLNQKSRSQIKEWLSVD